MVTAGARQNDKTGGNKQRVKCTPVCGVSEGAVKEKVSTMKMDEEVPGAVEEEEEEEGNEEVGAGKEKGVAEAK